MTQNEFPRPNSNPASSDTQKNAQSSLPKKHYLVNHLDVFNTNLLYPFRWLLWLFKHTQKIFYNQNTANPDFSYVRSTPERGEVFIPVNVLSHGDTFLRICNYCYSETKRHKNPLSSASLQIFLGLKTV